jgi:carbon storage regulator
MLILSRKPGESIVIDGRIIVKIVRVDGDTVKLGVEAPETVTVHRQEVHEEIQNNNKAAAMKPGLPLPKLAPARPAAQVKTGQDAGLQPPNL